jgi:hypothetical protein
MTEENTDRNAEFMAAEIHRPDDVPHGTPLTSMAEKRTEAGLRLLNNTLPDDFPHQVERGTVGDALTQLALGEAISRTMGNQRGSTIREALLLGADWDQVAAALDTTVRAAADELRVWADGQHSLYQRLLAEDPDNRIGLDDEAHAAMMGAVDAVAERAADARDIYTDEAPRGREAIAAVPMLDTVGELRSLLEQLPDEMPLSLDDYHRALPGEGDRVHTVHPRRVAMVSGLGTDHESHQPGLMLTQVYVPDGASAEEQAAVAARDDLPPAFAELGRAAYYLGRGDLERGLGDVAEVLAEASVLVGDDAAGYVATGSESANALNVEADRITHTAARVRKLANEVEAAE